MRPDTATTAAHLETEFVLPQDFRDLRVHLVGIGGSGMCGLAAFLLRRGATVSGSDRQATADLVRLTEAGATVTTDQSATAVPPNAQLLVRSAAIPEDHAEIRAARQRGVTVLKYAEMLGALMARCDGIAISGTHGKSTTTAWLTYVLCRAGLDPSFVIGANATQLGGGSGVGDGQHFVAEACEYDRSFLNLRPRRAAILNIEEDHLDCYADLDAIVAAFGQFADGVARDGLLVVNADDACCRQIAANRAIRVQTFGSAAGADWRAEQLSVEDGCHAFEIVHDGQTLGRVRLGIAGRHNADNALAVAALAHDCGVSAEHIRAGLAGFCGAQRRLELRGEVGGVKVADDYAHHPTEIRATLQAARERFDPRRLWCIFQPHQHSRTRFLLDDFADSFRQADRVVVPDIYFVRDSQRDREAVCAADLVERIRACGHDAEYIPAFDGIVARVAEAVGPGDVVLTMGAGNVWNVADDLLRRLRGDLPA